MAAEQRDAMDTVRDRLGPRWQAVDSLLPEPSVPPVGCGEEFTVTAPSGDPTAVARCAHWTGEAGSLDLCWARPGSTGSRPGSRGRMWPGRWTGCCPPGVTTWPGSRTWR